MNDLVDDRALCRFFFLNNNCRFGDRCSFSHVLPEGGIEEARKMIPCPFFARGKCKYGDSCQLMHETCIVIPPTRDRNNDTDIDDDNNSLTCGICLESVNSTGGRGSFNRNKYGLLSGCNHVFCYSCLMEWRKEGSREAEDRRCCPTCRTHSNYVVPSQRFAVGEEKEEIIFSYKERLSKIPCKKFDGILGSCPFGKDCFYMHTDDDGIDIKFQDKSMKELQEEQFSIRNEHDLHQDDAFYSDDVIDSLFLMLDLIWNESDESDSF